jgi:hypothetical protein
MRVLYLPAFVRDLKRLQGAREYARIRRLAFDAAPASVNLEERAQGALSRWGEPGNRQEAREDDAEP